MGQGGVRRSDYKVAGGNFRGDEYAHYLDCADGSMVYEYVKTHQIVDFKYAVYCVPVMPQ